ncbi:MAG: hypothetical protein BGO43_00300 [Gammaproteobacteria bacterium 39-13]|nr:hypothetical protein [Gammaproteobacteria bacterium]OJV96703.1 MAG: hypothetical protein BGO43_00300 [Gammaproteobacteria bacterium 39-13]
MAGTVIPSLSQQNLDVLGPESNSRAWKRDFYTRIIHQTVGLNIDSFDYRDVKGLARAKALKAFVENWKGTQARDTLLAEMMNSFDKVAQQSLPGNVTRRFTTSYTKTVAKEAYQRLILLEVIYHIDSLLEEEKQKKTPLSKEWQALEQWTNAKKSQFKPSFSLYGLINEARLMLFGTFFEDSYAWARYTIPFLMLGLFKHMINSPRRVIKTNNNLLTNLLYFVAIPLQAGLYPLAFFLGGIAQIIGLANKITSLPLEFVGQLFGNGRLRTGLAFINAIKSLVLSTIIFAYPLSYLFSAFSMVAMASFALTVVGGTLLFAGDKILNALGMNAHLQDVKSPLMGWRAMAVLFLSALVPSFSANRVNELIKEGEKIVRDIIAIEAKGTELSKNCKPENLKERQDHYKNMEASYEKAVRLMDRTIGLDFSPLKQELLNTAKQKLQLAASTENGSGQDYDKNKLLGKMMRLKANMEKTKREHGAEFAEKISKINNPIVYLNAFKTKAELPSFLQPLAEGSTPSASNDETVQNDNRSRVMPQ